jgi:hypothetical protein
MAGVIDWSQDFEGSLGDGTAVTTSNLTGNQFHLVQIGAGNSAEIDTTAPLTGARSLRVVKGSGSVQRTNLFVNTGAGAWTAAFRALLRMVARPALSETLLRAFTDGTTHTANRIDVLITSTGRLQIIDTLSGNNASSSVGLNAGQAYYLEGLYDSNVPGSGFGTLTVRAYVTGSPTVFASVSLATFGIYFVNEWSVGEISANASNLDLSIDQLAFGHDGFLDRTDYTPAAPAVIAQADKVSASGTPISVTATATSTSPNLVTSITAACVAASTPGVAPGSIVFTNTLINGSTTASSVTSVSTTNLFAGTYTIRFTVTDSVGQTSTDDVIVYVDTTSTLAESVVTAGGGTATGAADTMTALRDNSDTGYVVFTAPNAQIAEYRVSPLRVGSSVTVTTRAKVSSSTGSVKTELYEGATNRTPGRSAVSVTTSFANYTVTLTSPEVASIVDWTNLRVRLTMTSP